MRKLQEAGVWILNIKGGSDTTIYDVDMNIDLAVVFGSEAKGARKLTESLCDITASIPMKGKLDSLNVSVATGITLFEILRQRDFKRRRGPA